MEYDIMQKISKLNLSQTTLRQILCLKLKTTGTPFFNYDEAFSFIFKNSKLFKNDFVGSNKKEDLIEDEAFNLCSKKINDRFISLTSVKEKNDIDENNMTMAEENTSTLISSVKSTIDMDVKVDKNCKICMAAKIQIVFLPCTHMITCLTCALSVAKCPICRIEIKYIINPVCL